MTRRLQQEYAYLTSHHCGGMGISWPEFLLWPISDRVSMSLVVAEMITDINEGIANTASHSVDKVAM